MKRTTSAREVAEAVGGAVLRRMGQTASRFQEESPLPVDVLESDEEYLVVFDVPGALTSDVQVNYANNTVSVRVDRFREYREGFDMVFPGRGLALDGEARLPEDAIVDAGRAHAELNDDGTLYVFLPKGEGDSTRIDVTEGTTDGADTRVAQTDADAVEPVDRGGPAGTEDDSDDVPLE